MNVKELIEHLKQFDGKLPVGTSDHYGSFEPIDADDFYVRGVNDDGEEHNILYISCPYLGPEPD